MSCVSCEFVSAKKDLADKEELAQLCVSIVLLSPHPAETITISTISGAIACSALREHFIDQTGSD